MKTDINLAIKRDRGSRLATSKRVKKIRLLAMAFLFSVAILSTGLFFIIAASPIPSLRSQEESTSNELGKHQQEFGKYLLVRSQLKDVKGLLETRPDLREKIDTVRSMVPAGVIISNIALDEKSISMDVSSSSLDGLAAMFSLIDEKVVSGAVPRTVTTSPITYTSAANQYSFQLSFK